MNLDKLFYYLIRIMVFPLGFLSQSAINQLGKGIGLLAFYLIKPYRKRTLSNLALATTLSLSEKDLIKVAKQSFQNLAIICLEYPKFARLKNLNKLLICENPEEAEKLSKEGKGMIFFCGHQANWEVLFLEGTQRMPGVAIGKEIKNQYLYRWIITIRERFGGKIISPKMAFKEGLRAIKQGKFLGIIADQGMPESSYSFDFFGRRGWTTPAPALLSYKTRSPIFVATLRREKGKYLIHYSPPIWPNLEKPLEEEVERMTRKALALLEESIRKRPGQWLWQHNRWKQETPQNVYYRYRWDAILIILPKTVEKCRLLFPHLKTFRLIYPKAFLSLLCPEQLQGEVEKTSFEILPFNEEKELFVRDFRFKFVFNFSGIEKLRPHFLSLSAFDVLTEKKIKALAALHAQEGDDFSAFLKKALTRPSFWKEKP
ncbi:MAG: hypothetical protein HYZ47_05105 [Simkania negevensis]|nr:hypothetical protein [Simkania negevensis]